MKPPASSPTPPPKAPAPPAPAPSSPPQKQPSQPNSAGVITPRGEDFDISTPPTGPNNKKRLSAEWNWSWLIVAFGLLVLCIWLFAYNMGNRAQKPLPLGPIVTKGSVAPATTVTVHVAGAVARPGVYSVGSNARIADALAQAGGATPDADTTNLNLAAFVQDGAQIVVPVQAAPASPASPPPSTNSNTQPAPPGIVSPPTAQPATPTGTISPAAAQKAAQIDYLRAHPIDLNQATSFELQQLPGIGPAMAEDIIAYRTANGLFRSVSDLDNVKGIGEKRMETLKDLVVVK